MSERLRHWAAPYIALPWQPGAEGPRAFYCWGLVRVVERDHFGRQLPDVTGIPAAIDGWHRVAAPAVGDIVEMLGAAGPHVGVMIDADGRAGVLHAVGFRDADGVDHGDVRFSQLDELGALGLGRLRYWTPR